MAENSGIEWTDNTFNPWMGCTKVSPAFKNCYAERDFDHRYKKVNWGPSGDRRVTTESNWKKPLKWNAEAATRKMKGPTVSQWASGTGPCYVRPRVFCASLADVFEDWNGPMLNHKGEDIGLTMQEVRQQLFELIDKTPELDWLLLTKRPENVANMWVPRDVDHPNRLDDGYHRSNVWLGTSIENQEWSDKRLRFLRDAKERMLVSTTFVSAEPLVGPIDLGDNHKLDWVITGGESGPGARPCEPDWFRSLRDQCEASGTPFHFKQWGEFNAEKTRVGKKNAGRLLDGRTHDGLPRQVAMN